MEQLQKKFILLIEDLAAEVSSSFKINRSGKNNLCSMLLYATIIENATACAHLMNRASFSSMPILIRVNFEALIDLKNSIDDDKYYKRLHSTFLKQKKKYLYNKVKRGNKESGSKSEEFKENEKEYIQTKREFREYRKDGFDPLKIKDKFKICDSLEDYEIYIFSLLFRNSQ